MGVKGNSPEPTEAPTASLHDLRQRAEEKAWAEEAHIPEALSPKAARKVSHELRIHQIELEMARAELEASRARYVDLYDQAPVGYCTLNESGVILKANLTAAVALGISRDGMTNQSASRFVFPEDQDVYGQYLKQLFETGRPQLCELRMVKNDGTVFWVQIEASIAKNTDGESVCRAVFENITERKQAELRQQILIEVLSTLNEPLPIETAISRILGIIKKGAEFDAVGVRLKKNGGFPYFSHAGFSDDYILAENNLVACDEQGGVSRDKDGNVCLECTCGLVISGRTDPDNPFFTQNGSFWTNDSSALLGIPPDEDLRINPRNRCVHEGYGSLALIPIRMNQKIVGLLQLNARKKGLLTHGMVRFFEGLSESLGAALVKQQIEEQLHESKEMLDQFMAHLPIFSFIKESTPTESRVLHASDNFMQMIGLSGSDMIGKTMDELFPPELAAKITADDWAVVSGGESLEIEESLNDRHYISVKFPLVQGSRTLLGGYTVDVTERRQSEEDHKRLEEQLHQSQKMEAVGRLAGGVAHDFNNMLQIILGNTELLLNSNSADSLQNKHLESIAVAGRRAADITRQLLAFACKESAVLKVLNINYEIETMLNPLRNLLGETIDLSWSPSAVPCFVKTDHSQLNRILTNLVVNARDAITGTGKIYIKTEKTEIDKKHKKNGCQPGTYVLISVRDTGCGIAKEMLDCIFEPFFTTKPEYLGVGLGLASLHGIVVQNKGLIEVESEVGKGTIFKIYLPCHMAEEAERADTNRQSGSPGKTETILLVEQEEALLSLCKNQLEQLGYKVIAFSDSDETLNMVRNYKGNIDLLLSDVSMPKMQGPELARRLSVFRPQLKCIFMSGYTSEVLSGQQALHNKNRNFLQKPFSLEDMAMKIDEVLSTNAPDSKYAD